MSMIAVKMAYAETEIINIFLYNKNLPPVHF